MPWYAYVAISALSIAAVGILQKKTLEEEHSLEYVTVFSTVKLILFGLTFGFTTDWALSGGYRLIAVASGVINALAFLFIAKAMRRMELSTVMPVLSLEPALVALMALLTLGETLTQNQLIGLMLTLLGTYVLELRRHSDELHGWAAPFRRMFSNVGGRYALWGLLFFTFGSVIDRFALQHAAVLPYMGYVFLAATAFYVLLSLTSGERPPFFAFRRRWILPMIILIAALHLISNLTQAQAISLAAVGLVIAVKRTAALIDVIVGGRFFHERHLMQKTLASIIILTGVYFIVTG